MRRYETIIIVRPNAGEEKNTEIVNKISTIITNDSGTIIRIDKWGLKKLAYLIDKENQGYYIHIDYAGIPSMVTEIERISKIDDNILKYMTVKLADSCDPESLIQEMAKAEEAAAEGSSTPDSETDKEAEDDDSSMEAD